MTGKQEAPIERPALQTEQVEARDVTFPGDPEGNREAMAEALLKGAKVYQNLDQDIVIITTTRLKLFLLQHKSLLASNTSWIAPAGILLSLLVALISTDFKRAFGLSPDTWKALFLFFSAFALIWLIINLVRVFLNSRKGGVDALIDMIKTKKSD